MQGPQFPVKDANISAVNGDGSLGPWQKLPNLVFSTGLIALMEAANAARLYTLQEEIARRRALEIRDLFFPLFWQPDIKDIERQMAKLAAPTDKPIRPPRQRQRAGITKNKRRGTSKSRRKMAQSSRRRNRN